jgi:hypothetical protein
MIISATTSLADTKTIYALDNTGERIEIATLELNPNSAYDITMNADVFSDHFLSMRPFKCLESAAKHWCHVPYPYEINRNIGTDFTDLSYDLLFVWKGANDYGINMWNGVFYEITEQDGELLGRMREFDMDVLAVPPAAGELRPLDPKYLHDSDPEGHWLPRIVIE